MSITDTELKALIDQIRYDGSSEYDDERDGWYSIHVDETDDGLVLTSIFEYAGEGDEVKRDITARWKMILLDTASEDYT